MVTEEHPLLQQLYVALLFLCISVCTLLFCSAFSIIVDIVRVCQISRQFSGSSESLSELDFRH